MFTDGDNGENFMTVLGCPQFGNLANPGNNPDDVTSIERYAVLSTFRDVAKAKWLEWNGKVKELQIKEKEEELAYHKDKIGEIEKEILEIKNT